MARVGRPPKPTALHVLAGNPSKKNLSAIHEPQHEIAVPSMPDGLSPAARAEWKRVVPELVKVGTIARIDRASLTAYCEAWATWQRANRELARPGAALVQMTSGGESLSAWLRVRTAAAKELRDFAQEFGMTPAARTRVQAPAKRDESDAREATIASLVR